MQINNKDAINFRSLNWRIEYSRGDGERRRNEEHTFTEQEKSFIQKYTGEDRVYAYLRTINLLPSEEKEEAHNSEDSEIESLGQSKKKIKEY